MCCRTWNSLQYSFLSNWLVNGTYPRRDAILAETAFVNKATSDTDPYDQYEFSIPIENAGDCLEKASPLFSWPPPHSHHFIPSK